MNHLFFILLFLTIETYSSNIIENVPNEIYFQRLQKELIAIESLHPFNNMNFSYNNLINLTVFGNIVYPQILNMEIENDTITMEYINEELKNNTSPYHLYFKGYFVYKDISYPISFILFSTSYVFTKEFKNFSDYLILPFGSIQIKYKLLSFNYTEKLPVKDEVLQELIEKFIVDNENDLNTIHNENGISAFYLSIPFGKVVEKINVMTTKEKQFVECFLDKTYEKISFNEKSILFEYKGLVNENTKILTKNNFEKKNDDEYYIKFNKNIFENLIDENLLFFSINQDNLISNKFKLSGEYLKKIFNCSSISDNTTISLLVNQTDISYENHTNEGIEGTTTFLVQVNNDDDEEEILSFDANIKFILKNILLQHGFNFQILPNDVIVTDITNCSVELIDKDSLIDWINDSLSLTLGIKQFSLFKEFINLNEYFNNKKEIVLNVDGNYYEFSGKPNILN